MTIIDKVTDYINNLIHNLKKIRKQNRDLPNVEERVNHTQFCFLMELLDRCDMFEIIQASRQIRPNTNSFWSSVEPKDNIVLINSGKVPLITNKLLDITNELFKSIDIDDENYSGKFEEINKTLKLERQIIDALKGVLLYGDGAFFLYVDNGEVNFKFLSGRNIRYEKDRNGKIKEIINQTIYEEKGKTYLLEERYGKGYIHYVLFNEAGAETPLFYVPELADLENVDITDNKTGNYIDLIFAVPFKIYESTKYIGRGQSIFENKIDYLEALDEILSQRQTELRKASSKLYIPTSYLAKDRYGNTDVRKTTFNDYYEVFDTDPVAGNNRIETSQSELRSDEYKKAETDMEDHIYAGLIDRHTLEHSDKTVNNNIIASQNEALTIFTESKIQTSISEIVPDLVYLIMYFNDLLSGQKCLLDKETVNVTMIDYGNPTFEDKMQLSIAIHDSGALPNFERLKLLYGADKTEEEIQEIALKCDELDRNKAGNVEENFSNINDNEMA